jgi:phage terminase large subunit-like protein
LKVLRPCTILKKAQLATGTEQLLACGQKKWTAEQPEYIHYSGTKIPLYRFGVTPKRPTQGATIMARQRRDRSMTAFENAFISEMRSGHTGIFERVGRRRFPVQEVMAVSTAQMAADSGVMDKAEKSAHETIITRTEHEISRILNGYGVK